MTTKSGRPKVPSALKKLRGTDQPSRMNPDEPTPDILVSASCPKHLLDDVIARETWETYLPLLIDMRVMTATDLLGLEKLCEIVSDIRETRDMVKEYGRIIYTEKYDSAGDRYITAKANPAVNQHNALLQQFRAYAGAYGLTPSDRVRLKVEKPDKDESGDRFDI